MGKKSKCRLRQLYLEDKFLSLDRYSYPVSFNVNGRKSISSYPGTITTLIVFAILICYAIIKFQSLIYFQNPSIGQAIVQNQFQQDYEVNLKNLGFKIAFGVNDYSYGTPLDDPDYVQWVVRLNQYENQKSVNKTNIKFHKCTQEDFDSFYPPAEGSAKAIAVVRSYSLYCIDEPEHLTLFGSTNFYYQRFEVMLMPCQPDFVRNICINRTLQQTLNYLQTFGNGSIPDFYIMENTQRFDLYNFKNITVIKESVVNSHHLNLLTPSTMEGVFNIEQVQDKSSLLNLWSQKDFNMFQIQYKQLRPSSSNRFPQNYKFVGAEYIFNTDQQVFSRQTYDFLNWIGDVGGLDVALSIIGSIIISTYSKFNAYACLTSLIFVQSTNAFQSIRNSLKPQSNSVINNSNQIKNNAKILQEHEIGLNRETSIFQKFNQNAFVLNIKQDFLNRTNISQPSVFQTLIGLFCCKKSYNRFRRMNKRGRIKADKELDIIRIIKKQRVNVIELQSLLPTHMHQFAKKLGEAILSEFSSENDSKSDFDSQILTGEKFDQFVNAMISEKSEESQRLFSIYSNQDLHRTKKWEKKNPDQAIKQNILQLKHLIAHNLIRPQNTAAGQTFGKTKKNKQDSTSFNFLDETDRSFHKISPIELEQERPFQFKQKPKILDVVQLWNDVVEYN